MGIAAALICIGYVSVLPVVSFAVCPALGAVIGWRLVSKQRGLAPGVGAGVGWIVGWLLGLVVGRGQDPMADAMVKLVAGPLIAVVGAIVGAAVDERKLLASTRQAQSGEDVGGEA